MHSIDQFWAGTESSLATFLMSMKQFAGTEMPVKSADVGKGEAVSAPRLFSQSGNVGIISIAGPLVNNDSWINEYVGRTGYPEIRAALIHAAMDPTVGAIVLDINSGGGSVSGVSDVAELISKIDTTSKPVTAFSDGMIASAAYWLGSSARTLDIGKVTEAGSIGVLVIHQEMSQMLRDSGITATVIRAGEFKALGNPYEKLSDTAKGEIQGQLDQLYTMFIDHVSEARGVSYAVADKKMGQGKVFLGAEAVKVGLADSVSTFDAVVSKAQGAIDSQKKAPQYGANLPKGTTVSKAVLTEQHAALAALAGTLNPVALAALVAVATPEAAAVEPAAEASAAEPVAETAPATETAAPAAEVKSDLNDFLKGALAEAQATITDLTVKLRDSQASAASMTANHAALRNIANASVDQLKVVFGGSSGGAQALSDESLLAEHASLRAQFESKFKAGGVAAVSSADSSDKVSEVAADPARQARLASTRA